MSFDNTEGKVIWHLASATILPHLQLSIQDRNVCCSVGFYLWKNRVRVKPCDKRSVMPQPVKETFLFDHPGTTLAVTLAPPQAFAAGTDAPSPQAAPMS